MYDFGPRILDRRRLTSNAGRLNQLPNHAGAASKPSFALCNKQYQSDSKILLVHTGYGEGCPPNPGVGLRQHRTGSVEAGDLSHQSSVIGKSK